jgi:phosphoenolpyruvate carboxykinase (ATP)
MPIEQTRTIVAAILDGSLDDAAMDIDSLFGFAVPRAVTDVPASLLRPRDTWPDGGAYDEAAHKLARDLAENFTAFDATAPVAVREAGPGRG